ncbi:hypothetical protein RGQ29_001027 [Quercus rubra]|uniref:Uncharacterized protein n=1 Tax=Quercus rubra TaxID=3512 RepID=A0AAN7G4W7_QUERU|nr:hypothetical protein RGQ29_001027 [Quercus rubra]
MVSVLVQERLLGAALGSILTGIVVFEQRRTIYRSISQSDTHSHVGQHLSIRKKSFLFAGFWGVQCIQCLYRQKCERTHFWKEISLRVSTSMEQSCGSDVWTCY